jgi:hypothetical protein
MNSVTPEQATERERAERLIKAISSRALFTREDSHRIYTEQGEMEYAQYHINHENYALQLGVAFALAKKLLALNAPNCLPLVDVVLTSHNNANTGPEGVLVHQSPWTGHQSCRANARAGIVALFARLWRTIVTLGDPEDD